MLWIIQGRGFSRIELSIVSGVVVMFAIAAILVVGEARQWARDVARVSQIQEIRSRLGLYFHQHADYPEQLERVEKWYAYTRQEDGYEIRFSLEDELDVLQDTDKNGKVDCVANQHGITCQ